MTARQGVLFVRITRMTYRVWKRRLIREALGDKKCRRLAMNKKELIATMAEIAEMKKVEAERALNAFTEAVTEALASGDKVRIAGFGSFYVTERAERKGRNPRTGEEMTIPARKVVKFRGSKGLLDG